eukprot:214385_1
MSTNAPEPSVDELSADIDNIIVAVKSKSIVSNLNVRKNKSTINITINNEEKESDKENQCEKASLVNHKHRHKHKYKHKHKHRHKHKAPGLLAQTDYRSLLSQEYDAQKFNVHYTLPSDDDKPFKCKYCPIKFKKKQQRKYHQFIHTGEKQHKCTHCNKEFIQIATLQQHIRTHTG